MEGTGAFILSLFSAIASLIYTKNPSVQGTDEHPCAGLGSTGWYFWQQGGTAELQLTSLPDSKGKAALVLVFQ